MATEASSHFRRLFEPLKIGNFEVRNRVLSTPHSPRLAGDRDLRYWEERAKGGVALFGFASGLGVHGYDKGVGAKGNLGQWDQPAPDPLSPAGMALYDDLEIPRLRAMARAVHAHGARCFAQMAHAGASFSSIQLNARIAPSNVATPFDGLAPHALYEDEVEALVQCFAQHIRRVAEAGLDAAEIHGAHGYMVNQFLSPYYNRREDRWGGSLANRARFPLAIIAEARKLVGDDFPIGIRMSFEGDGNGPGMTIADLVETARLLEPHVCHVSVSGGNGVGVFDGYQTSYFSSFYREPAYNAQAAAAVREAVKVPVFIAGRIADPAIAESMVAQGVADMVGMVRGLIADPQLIEKARRGEPGRQRMCLGLSECHHEGKHKVNVTCAVNAAAGREEELAIVPAESPRTVVVVGAGPAGMEAARVAARRGHKVFLCDRAREIGGTVRILANDPNRRNLRDHSVYFEAEFPDLDVEMVLGHEVSAEDVLGFGADTVVIATGGKPIIPDVPGIERDNVVTVLDVLRGKSTVGRRALVVCGTHAHMAGPAMADYLTDKGHEVILIGEQYDFAPHIEDVTRFTLQQRLHRKRLLPQVATRLVAVDEKGTVIRDVLSGEERRIDDVTVVLACGLIPDDRLHRELKGKVADLHLIGDALAPRRIMHATIEGARTGVAI